MPSKEIYTNFMDDSSISFGELEKMMFPTITPGCHQPLLLTFPKSGWQLPGPKIIPDGEILEALGDAFLSLVQEGFPGVPNGISWKIYEKCPGQSANHLGEL